MEEKLFDFGEAIKALKDGHAIARKSWNSKNLFVVKQIPATIEGLIIDKIQSLPNSCKELIKQKEGDTVMAVLHDHEPHDEEL